ncbi:MAG: pentapeptide repeat-containing protein [Polyangiales bacterium]
MSTENTTEAGDLRALALQGADAFNAWRRANLDATVDLTGADLRGADLRGALLAGAILDGARLDDAALATAILSGASLKGASLRRADLRGACFGFAELIESSLAMSPLGSALMSGASLDGASLEGARAQQARFVECDLTGCDLTDCDLRGADLRRTGREGAADAPPPDFESDLDALWDRLRAEPLEVREGIFLFGLLVFLSGDRSGEGADVLTTIVEEFGFTQADVNRLSPSGQVVLKDITVTPPASQWARRVTLILMTGLAGTSTPVRGAQLNVLGHFGEQLGFSDRALARVLGEELGLTLTVQGA